MSDVLPPRIDGDASTPRINPNLTEGVKVAEISTRKAGTHGCARCSKRWGGLNTAHCAACHETFTGLTAFDKHRDGSHSKGTRACLEPAEVGLVDANRAYPCWGWPSDGDDRWATEIEETA